MEHEGAFVVTGASQGIGREVAMQLARAGRSVVMVARDSPRLTQSTEQVKASARGARVLSIPADLSLMAEVLGLALRLGREVPRISALIHCAGVILPQRRVTREGFETTFATNAVAPFLLTQLLFDCLREGAPSRVLFVYGGGRSRFAPDDLMSERDYRGWKSYNQSKNADLMVALELARRWEGSGIAVNAVLPGIVNTGILRALPTPMRLVLAPLRPVLRTPAHGALVAVWAATAPAIEGVSGRLFGSLFGDPRREFKLPRAVRDEGRRRRLFDALTALVASLPGRPGSVTSRPTHLEPRAPA